MSQSTKEVQAVRDHLSQTVESLTNRVDTLSEEQKNHNATLSDEIKCQNILILGMQTQFQETMTDFSTKLQAIYSTTNTNNPSTSFVSPSASTSKTRHWGDQIK